MKYTMVRLLVVAVACCAMAVSTDTASAGWGLLHGGGSSGGAYGGYGSSGGYASYSYGSSGGGSAGYYAGYGSSGGYGYAAAGGSSGGATASRVGPLRRLLAHHHDRKAARRASYSSGYGSSGGYAGYGSSGGYVTSYGSSGGAVSYGSSGYSTSYGVGYGSTGSYGVPASPAVPYTSGYLGVSNQSPTASASLASHQTGESDAVYLNVNVPASAKVFVNDLPTTSTGPSRQFVSRGLVEGKKYKFNVRAEVIGADGQVATESKTVTLTAGERDELSFASLADTPVQTTVTLNVPADANVVLAGNPTNAAGETRTFRTAQLKAGEQWDDYVVEVHYEGKVKRETLRLVAGDDIALTFNFNDDASLVASR